MTGVPTGARGHARDQPPARSLAAQARAAIPTLLAAGIGVLMSAQVLVNGRLSEHLGSAEYVASVNNLFGLALLAIAATALGAPRRAVRTLRVRGRPPWWCVAAGANGALSVAVSAAAATRVGLSMVTVALVFGQLAGGTLVDRFGLSPAGRRDVTWLRAAAVVLALLAAALGVSTISASRVPLLAAVALLGGGQALQQAAMGRVAQATGEPLAAGMLNLAAGAALLVVITLASTGAVPPHGFSAPAVDWTGGLVAASATLGITVIVRRLGVLRLTLAIIAGQTLGSLALDAALPTAPHPVSVLTVVSVALTVAAVWISGRRRRAARVAPVAEPLPARLAGAVAEPPGR